MPHVTVNGKKYTNKDAEILKSALDGAGYQAERNKDYVLANQYWQAAEYVFREYLKKY